MGSWKNHVRARLQQRDLNEKVPFVGVYTSCAQTLRIFLFPIMIRVMNVGLNNLPVSPQYFSWKSALKLANTFWMTFSPRGMMVFTDALLMTWRLFADFFFLLYSISSQFDPSGVEVGRNARLLQLQLRESEHLTEKVR